MTDPVDNVEAGAAPTRSARRRGRHAALRARGGGPVDRCGRPAAEARAAPGEGDRGGGLHAPARPDVRARIRAQLRAPRAARHGCGARGAPGCRGDAGDAFAAGARRRHGRAPGAGRCRPRLDSLGHSRRDDRDRRRARAVRIPAPGAGPRAAARDARGRLGGRAVARPPRLQPAPHRTTPGRRSPIPLRPRCQGTPARWHRAKRPRARRQRRRMSRNRGCPRPRLP